MANSAVTEKHGQIKTVSNSDLKGYKCHKEDLVKVKFSKLLSSNITVVIHCAAGGIWFCFAQMYVLLFGYFIL